MTDHSSEGTRLSDSELTEVLALTKDADSVELKLTVPDPERRATVNALGIDALDAQIRHVFFFDTPDLALNRHGVVVRARQVQGRGDDSVDKLRPIVPNELPEELRKSRNLVVEVDAMPGGCVCSASIAEIRAFLTGRGVDLSGEQQTKTKAALEYFAASMGTAAGA